LQLFSYIKIYQNICDKCHESLANRRVLVMSLLLQPLVAFCGPGCATMAQYTPAVAWAWLSTAKEFQQPEEDKWG
jgi:hypothetical protein